MQDAVADVVGNAGGMPTGWMIAVAYVNSDGKRTWSWCCPDGQDFLLTAGLIKLSDTIISTSIEAHVQE